MSVSSSESLLAMTALELAEKFRAGIASPVDAARDAAAAIDRVDGAINAFRCVDPDAALKLDCGAGLGAATHITGTFAFVAAGKAIGMLLRQQD